MVASRKGSVVVVIDMPLPPSVNTAFVGRHGSHRTSKSAAYKFWTRCIMDEVSVRGLPDRLSNASDGAPYGLWIDLPFGMRGDIDNRVKLISDMLCEKEGGLGVVQDDKSMRYLYVQKADLPQNRCTVVVVARAMWASYVGMRIE